MLRDESFHPLEFDHHLFFNKDSKNPLPSSWITSQVHPIIERVRFQCSSFSSCLSCLSCLSMFPNTANRLNGTWSLLPIGHKGPLFHSRMIRPVVGGGEPACLTWINRMDRIKYPAILFILSIHVSIIIDCRLRPEAGVPTRQASDLFRTPSSRLDSLSVRW